MNKLITSIKALLRECIPPILLRIVRPFLGGNSSMVYLGDKWPSTPIKSFGWNEAGVANQMREWWYVYAQKVNSCAPLGISPWDPDARNVQYHNWIMTFSYVLARAAHKNDTLSVLDYGGTFGHYALVAKKMLPEVSLDYTVKEVENLCKAGSELQPDIVFTSNDDVCFSRSYDLVFASNSIQYFSDWKSILNRLAQAADKWLLITVVETVINSPRFVIVQHAQKYFGSQTEFRSWVFNRNELLEYMDNLGLILDREFLAGGLQRYKNAPEASERVGFLFRKA